MNELTLPEKACIDHITDGQRADSVCQVGDEEMMIPVDMRGVGEVGLSSPCFRYLSIAVFVLKSDPVPSRCVLI